MRNGWLANGLPLPPPVGAMARTDQVPVPVLDLGCTRMHFNIIPSAVEGRRPSRRQGRLHLGQKDGRRGLIQVKG